jgi:hypothetical protein
LIRTLVAYRHLQTRCWLSRQQVPAGPGHRGAAADRQRPDLHLQTQAQPEVRPPVNRAITSKDIAYAFQRINAAPLVAQYGFYYFGIIKGIDGQAKTAATKISGIETPDHRTITFRLTNPAGDFLNRLAMPATGPSPRRSRTSKSILRRYQADPRKRHLIQVNAGDRTWYITMSTAVPPFDDVHVRRAVNYVIDKQGMAEHPTNRRAHRDGNHRQPRSLPAGRGTSRWLQRSQRRACAALRPHKVGRRGTAAAGGEGVGPPRWRCVFRSGRDWPMPSSA